MKLKRILSFAVALCMVMAFVPAIGLTASAAETTDLLGLYPGAEVVWSMPTNTGWNDTAVSSGLAGWTSTNGGGSSYINLKHAGGLSYLQVYGSNPNVTAVSPGYAAGSSTLIIEAKYCRDSGIGNTFYHNWTFKDIDGKEIGHAWIDRNQSNFIDENPWGFPGYNSNTKVGLVAVNNDDGTHNNYWYVNGELKITQENREGTVNGFGSIAVSGGSDNQWKNMHFGDITISAIMPETVVKVEATYVADDEARTVIAKKESTYDTAKGETAATFAAFSGSVNGLNNIYYADEATLSESGEIVMSATPNRGAYEVGSIVAATGKAYKIVSENLIPNYDYAEGVLGWYNSSGENISVTPTDGSIKLGGQGGGNAASLCTSWELEDGVTYLYTYNTTDGNVWHISSLENTLAQDENSASDARVLVGTTNNSTKIGELAASDAAGQNMFAFTNDHNHKYLQAWFRWSSNSLKNFGLYKVEEVSSETVSAKFVTSDNTVVKEVSEVVAIGGSVEVTEEDIFVIDANNAGHFYRIPATTVDSADMVINVNEAPNKYAVMEDALVSGDEIWGVKKANNNSVFVSAGGTASYNGPEYDANGVPVADGTHTPSKLGTSRAGFVEFPIVDLEAGQKAIAKFYVRTWHDNGFSNGNTSLRLAAYVINDRSWTELSDGNNYYVADAPILATYPNAIFSEAHDKSLGYIEFDVTEAMMAAKAAGLETLDLRLASGWGAAYIAEREAAVEGGAYEGRAAYIEVVDAEAFEVTATGGATLTKNGSAVSGVAYVTAEDDVRLVANAAVVATDKGYVMPNENLNVTEATAFGETAPKALGLAMVDGAQVRVGDGANAEGKVAEGSGLRFIATADLNETLVADEAVEYGIKITADGNDTPAYIAAAKAQNEYNDVFSVAITNLKESNYNRPYTAVAYAKVTMADGTVKEFNSASSVTRSIYQVSAGIMKNNAMESDYVNSVDQTIVGVLNAYINQVGIRLGRDAEGNFTAWESGDGSYSGDVFFTVESTTVDGVTTVTVTPNADWANTVKIADWWQEKVRINNNHSKAVTFISEPVIDENGVLTFTFTIAQ